MKKLLIVTRHTPLPWEDGAGAYLHDVARFLAQAREAKERSAAIRQVLVQETDPAAEMRGGDDAIVVGGVRGEPCHLRGDALDAVYGRGC